MREDGSKVISPEKVKAGIERKCDWCSEKYTPQEDGQNLCSLKCGTELRMLSQQIQSDKPSRMPFERDMNKIGDLTNMIKGCLFWNKPEMAIALLKDLSTGASSVAEKLETMTSPSGDVEKIKKERLERLENEP